MNEVKIEKELEIEFTPKEVARLFTSLHSVGQAEFFSECAKYVKSEYTHGDIGMNLAYLMDHEELTDEGRELMLQIGEFAKEENE